MEQVTPGFRATVAFGLRHGFVCLSFMSNHKGRGDLDSQLTRVPTNAD